MDHAPYRFAGKEIPHPRSIGEIELDETKSFVRCQLGKPGLFQSHIIVVVDIVQADYLIATVQKAHGHMKSDEPRCSCDKNRRLCSGHDCSSTKNGLSSLARLHERWIAVVQPIQRQRCEGLPYFNDFDHSPAHGSIEIRGTGTMIAASP